MATQLIVCALALGSVHGVPDRALLQIPSIPTAPAAPAPPAVTPPPAVPTVPPAPAAAPVAPAAPAAVPAPGGVPPTVPPAGGAAPVAPAAPAGATVPPTTPPAVPAGAAVPPPPPVGVPPPNPALAPPALPGPGGTPTDAPDEEEVATGAVSSSANTTATGEATGVDAAQVETFRAEPVTPNEQQRTAADGYVYSFKLELVDYILPERVLPMANFSAPEAPPPALTAALRLPLADGLVTWDLAILNYNKALWARRANRKIGDAVTTLDDAAALAMREPVYVVTNKTQWLPEQRVNGTTFGGERQPRLYYSLSDFYHPSAVSKINEFGLPYEYSPSINTEAYELAPNKRHLELTIEDSMTLALAGFYLDNPAYSRRARDKIWAWFLDPEAGMLPTLRGAAVQAGATDSGRPEGVFDLARLPDLINTVSLLRLLSAGGAEPVWSDSDEQLFRAWITEYVAFLENDPLPRYARVMANYIGTSFDEQLLACAMYLGDAGKAATVINYTRLRKADQIVDGVLRYEKDRQRSLEFTQICMASWVRLALMAGKLGVPEPYNLWTNGLGLGHSIKDAFDRIRPTLESRGSTWPFKQIGALRVRIAGEMLPRLYVGYRLTAQGQVTTAEAVQRSETAPPPPPPINKPPPEAPAPAPPATQPVAPPPPPPVAPATPGTVSPGATLPPPPAPVAAPVAATPAAPAAPVAPATAPAAPGTVSPGATVAPPAAPPAAPAAAPTAPTLPTVPTGRRRLLQEQAGVVPPEIQNSGPIEYIQLYATMWPTFNSSGSQARAIIDRLPAIELDSDFALQGIPLIKECDSLSCDTRTLTIWSITAAMLLVVGFCLCWNVHIHRRADRATEVPKYLRNIRKQQAKYKEMNLRVAPAKPDYMADLKAKEAVARAKEERSALEEKANKELKKEISELEGRIQRKRESKMASQMMSQYGGSVYGSGLPSQYAPSVPYGSHAGSVAASSVYDNSFMQHPAMGPSGSNFAGGPSGWSATDGAAAGGAPAPAAPRHASPGFAQGIPEEAGEFSFPLTAEGDGVGDSRMSGVSPNAAGGGNTPISGPLSYDGSTPGAATGVTGLLAGAKEFLGEIDQTATLTEGGGGRSSQMRSPKQ